MTKLAEVLSEIEKNNVRLSLAQSVTGQKVTIKVEGPPDDVERYRPIITTYKTEIIRLLSGATDQTPALPPFCKADCHCLDVIHGIGPGCVRELASGDWCQEWLSLDRIGSCPKSKN